MRTGLIIAAGVFTLFVVVNLFHFLCVALPYPALTL